MVKYAGWRCDRHPDRCTVCPLQQAIRFCRLQVHRFFFLFLVVIAVCFGCGPFVARARNLFGCCAHPITLMLQCCTNKLCFLLPSVFQSYLHFSRAWPGAYIFFGVMMPSRCVCDVCAQCKCAHAEYCILYVLRVRGSSAPSRWALNTPYAPESSQR